MINFSGRKCDDDDDDDNDDEFGVHSKVRNCADRRQRKLDYVVFSVCFGSRITIQNVLTGFNVDVLGKHRRPN